jgi:hypothetical protein
MDIFFDQKEFDILLDGGDEADLVIITEPADLLTQRLYNRFKTYIRDLYWNQGYGIDYLTKFFGKNKKKHLLDYIIKEEIKKEVMVKDITYFESEVVDYKYACKFTVTLREEQTTITYYILTNESGIILTDEKGDQLTIRI